MVITLYPGQAAEEIEKQVTIPVERALTGTPRVLIQRSITSFGLSQVILTFEDDVDIYWARQQVAERLSDAEVPEGITPHLGPNDTPVGQVYQYTLESDHHSPSELRSWQDWVVSKNLMRAPGVADVVSFGGFQKECHVLADPGRLAQRRHHAEGRDRRGRGVERRDVGRLPAAGRVRAGRARPRLPEVADRHRQHGREGDQRNAGAGAQRRAGGRGVHAAARGGRARGRDRLRRGDRAAAARGEPEGGPEQRSRGGRRTSTARSCRRACASCRSTTARGWSTRRWTRCRTT